MDSKDIKFMRSRDYKIIDKLGEGACGKTVLLHDETINEEFVCKKFSPYYGDDDGSLFRRFLKEIKILYSLYHLNLVRVFNYYIYPDKKLGYIIMEYIKGCSIDEYLKKNPQNINLVFQQTIDAFCYLESKQILHRDIRPLNILIKDDGTVKIIDFGFGKQIFSEKDAAKSVDLAWWCETPNEFSRSIYNFRTEAYFIGQLFSKAILDNLISEFSYHDLLRKMAEKNPEKRVESFSYIQNSIQKDLFSGIEFSDNDLSIYRNFSEALLSAISKIDGGSSYIHDVGQIKVSLTRVFQNCMLEEYLFNPSILIKCFINGNIEYNTHATISTATIKEFLELYNRSSYEKRKIIIGNIHTRFDSLNSETRYSYPHDEDIPF